MTTYGRSARLLRRYGPWTLVVTTATVAAAYALNQLAPSGFASEATVLVETRLATVPAPQPSTAAQPGAGQTGTLVLAPVTPDIQTERTIALSDAVLLPAASRLGTDTDTFRKDLTVEVVPDTSVLRFVYTSDNPQSAQIRARALLEAYVNFRSDGPADVTALSEPVLATAPEERPLGTDLAAGLVAGLLLGAGTALIRSRTRGQIRGRDDFADLTGVPVLATVPRHKRPTGTTTGSPVVLREPESPAAESYRYLRSRLQPSLRPTSTTTILVTSPGDRQGRTTTAANLAVVMAQSGRSVVLIDADLRDPQMHHVFQVPGDYGLTTLLDGDATISEVIEDTSEPRLKVIPAGHRDGDHIDLIDSAQLARVIRAAQKHADVVILDSSAVLSTSDAIALAALSDHVLLVGDFARTSRESVTRALDELAEVLHDNVSPVLVNVPKSAGALIPHARVTSATVVHEPLTRARLTSDADDVAPPGITSHTYVDVEDDEEEHAALSDYYARTATVAVPVIYGSTQTATVYASSTAIIDVIEAAEDSGVPAEPRRTEDSEPAAAENGEVEVDGAKEKQKESA